MFSDVRIVYKIYIYIYVYILIGSCIYNYLTICVFIYLFICLLIYKFIYWYPFMYIHSTCFKYTHLFSSLSKSNVNVCVCVVKEFIHFHILPYIHTYKHIHMCALIIVFNLHAFVLCKSSSIPDASNVRWPKVFSCCAVACVILLAVRRKASHRMASQQWERHRGLDTLFCGKDDFFLQVWNGCW